MLRSMASATNVKIMTSVSAVRTITNAERFRVGGEDAVRVLVVMVHLSFSVSAAGGASIVLLKQSPSRNRFLLIPFTVHHGKYIYGE